MSLLVGIILRLLAVSAIIVQTATLAVIGLPLQVKADFGHQNRIPFAVVKNGTIRGKAVESFHQDHFLGVRFAQPPVGELRLRHPASLNSTWKGDFHATQHGLSCVGYAGFAKGLTMGEDCLTLDIVRPSGRHHGGQLPVFVWIYGGGFTAGGGADSRYNTSYLVQNSVKMGTPIIAVSINYRLGGWGFLASQEVQDAGASNIGLFDQRIALRWIHENIAAFGGDPNKVTISGESAGGFSVGYHLVGFDGDHGNLFRAAIMQSGTALGPGINGVNELKATYQPIYDNITETVGCSNSADSLECLRRVPFGALSAAFAPFVLTPILDGQFLSRLPSESFRQGLTADVAILTGSNTDEGTATFFGPRGLLQNDDDVKTFLSGMGSGLNKSTVSDLMRLYPDDPAQGCPFNTGLERYAQHGYQYKRGAAIVGDLVIHAGRRYTTRHYASLTKARRHPVFSYRFDQKPWNDVLELIATDAPVFATHYAEICFVFDLDVNLSRNNTNWIGPYRSYHRLAREMSQAWISFVYALDPSFRKSRGLPKWPEYGCGRENLVFRADGSFVEKDDWREDQLAYWGEIWSNLKT